MSNSASPPAELGVYLRLINWLVQDFWQKKMLSIAKFGNIRASGSQASCSQRHLAARLQMT
jgi:hypothetical protein